MDNRGVSLTSPMIDSPGATRRSSRGRRRPEHQGRVLALQVLYECDLAGHEWRPALDARADELHATPEAISFAKNCIEGVVGEQDNLDALIRRHQHQWPVEQLAAIDRAVLRLGLFELAENSRTPPLVAINEAVELAKTFGSEGSARFVNGVLGASFNEQNNRTPDC